MQTMQFQCGACSKLMAISIAHLGGQVQCPHCRAVVQTPAPAPAAAPNEPTVLERPPPAPSSDGESIFTPPEPSDALFDTGPERPLVEMPPAATAPAPEEQECTVEFATVLEPPSPPGAVREAPSAEPAVEEPPEELPAPQIRPAYDRSMTPLIALIFLVPYAAVTTAFIIYLVMQLRNQPHPLDYLPDPKTDKGGPRKAERIKHDYPLAAHQRVGLGALLHVGALEVSPQRVELNSEGNLVLRMKVRNVSGDLAFAPISDAFLLVQDRTGGKPYTFLQSDSFKPLYGGFLQLDARERGEVDGELGPGQEGTLVLTTTDTDRSTAGKIAASKERLLWRVQLRRGLVAHRGRSVSATTVVGVAFNARDIAKAR